MTEMPELASMIELAASYVAGKWVTSAAAVTMEVASPTTGEVLGTVGIAGDDEVSAAVAAPAPHCRRGRKPPPPIAAPRWDGSPMP